MAPAVELSGPGLSAGISPLGAELQWLRDAEGRDLLWDGDPAFWTGRAPILFPVIGAVAGGSIRVDGRTYLMPKHGVARHHLFTLVGHDGNEATFQLEADDETRKSFPFDFMLDIAFRIEGTALTMTATLTNGGNVPLPASFGFHPALRWPLPYGQARDAHRVRFAENEPDDIRRIGADGLLRPAAEPTPVVGRDLALADALFVDDALIFDRPRSRSLVYGAPGAPMVQVDYTGMPMLGLWTKPGAPYLCIEPWSGIAEPEGFSGSFAQKPGITMTEPGKTRRFAMRIAIGGETFS